MPYDLLLTGLGNPGERYRGNRHNAGFLLLDHTAAEHGITLARNRFDALVGDGSISGRRCLLAKPQTYMNRSGLSVQRMITYTGSSPEQLLVAYDDLDLPLGRLRLRRGGGNGGHRGVASIIEMLGTADFMRLRIGIGRPPDGMQVERYVLKDFSSAEYPLFRQILERSLSAVETVASEGLTRAMNIFNAHPPLSEQDG